MTTTAAMSLEERVRALGPWFHNIDLHGVRTAPDHFLGDYPGAKWRAFADALPADLRGKTVLDVGCNAGFHSVEMKRRGADRVVGIDFDGQYLEQARFVAETLQVDIELRQLSVYDVGALRERFDVVLFMGVLYHLRHPLLALDALHEHVTKDLFVFQSLLRGDPGPRDVADDYPFEERAVFDDPAFPRLHFIEKRYCGDSTNWWIPNRSGAEAMLRSAGFDVVGHPEAEVFLCRHRELPPGDLAGLPTGGR
jgi:tRNA (mo5U34)-methyltransferase